MLNPLACEWAPTYLLGLSPNVTQPIVYYAHYGAFLLVLSLLIFLVFTERKQYLGKVLIALMMTVCLWLGMDMYLWVATSGPEIMFLWSVMTFLEVSIYLLALFFIYGFVREGSPRFLLKLTGVLVYLIPAVLLPTQYAVRFFDMRDCNRNVVEGSLILYLYIPYAIIIGLVLLIMLVGAWKRRERAREILLVGFGTFTLLVVFLGGLAAGTFHANWILGQASMFILPMFLGFLTYSITGHDKITSRLLPVHFFVLAALFLIGAQFFFVKDLLGVVLILVTLILTLLFSIVITKAIRIELRRKADLQALTDSLTTANQQLKELDNAKTEFLSIASHQLRTPLTAIKGYISLILEGSYGEVSASVQDVLNKLYLVNSRMVNLAEDLLNVSRIDAGRVQYNYHKAQLEKVLQEAVEVFRLTAQERGLELNLELPENPLPEMNIDGRKIQEVCSNLVDNSIKYTQTGSVTVKLVAFQDRAVITVTDTGIGIAPENKEKLFAKFVRSKETNILDVSGTGLGLYVGKNFIEAHGGKIYADSEGKNKGSVFTIELPYINPFLNETAPNWMINN